jgi:hypothetical protein
MTPSRYAAANHITVSRRGKLHDHVDDALAAFGLSRRVVASAPTTAVTLKIITYTDLVVALPASVAACSLGNFALTTKTDSPRTSANCGQLMLASP